MVTLKDIAVAADLSISTISRVLNGTADAVGITKGTQKRVWQLADAMNYMPNKLARNLKLGRQPKAILFLYASDTGNGDGLLIHPFFSHMLHGIHLEVIKMRGCYLALMGANQRNIGAVAELLDQAVSGVITFGQLPGSVWAELDTRNIPTVSIEPYTTQERHAVYVDNELAVMQGLKHLYALGHRHIHFLYLPDRVEGRGPMAERKEAFLRGLGSFGLSVEGTIVYIHRHKDNNEIEAAGRSIYEVAAKGMFPDAILTCHDLSAIGALKAARELGIDVPGELSVVGIDDIDWARYTHPPLTTVRIPQEQMGARAADILKRLLKGQEGAPGKARMGTELMVRASTAPPASSHDVAGPEVLSRRKCKGERT